MKKKISVIIVSWNGELLIGRCLKALFDCGSGSFNLEVIAVDNGSSDQTVRIIEKEFPKVKIIKNKTNLGFAEANNQGIEETSGKMILLLNQDVFLEKGALREMADFLEKGVKGIRIGAVAPLLKYPNGKSQSSCRPFPSPVNIIWDSFTGGSWHRNFYSVSKSQIVDQPMASCLLVKKEALKRVGCFDNAPDFFLYFNDVDLSFRLKKAGFLHYFLVTASAVHCHGESAKELKEKERLRLWSRGLYYFLVKHYAYKSVFRKLFFRLLVGIISALRSLESYSGSFLKKRR
jgi:GT2 family glycosyltransferase